MADLLKQGGCMVHGSGCYEYAFEYTRFHLTFFTGKSLDFLGRTLNMDIELGERTAPASPFRKCKFTGHRGLVGSAILRRLQQEGFTNILCAGRETVDLIDQRQTMDFFMQERPDYVFLAAAKVGGIIANNTYPAEFIYNNLMIGCNIINAAKVSGVKKLLNLGSSCIYPRMAPQPMKEEALLTGTLEPTNEGYAFAKIAAIKLCEYYNKAIKW